RGSGVGALHALVVPGHFDFNHDPEPARDSRTRRAVHDTDLYVRRMPVGDERLWRLADNRIWRASDCGYAAAEAHTAVEAARAHVPSTEGIRQRLYGDDWRGSGQQRSAGVSRTGRSRRA